MRPGWSIPVTQALQRHSGGWGPTPAREKADRDELVGSPAVERPLNAANERANAEAGCPSGAAGARADALYSLAPLPSQPPSRVPGSVRRTATFHASQNIAK
jgi:hypothetical protein